MTSHCAACIYTTPYCHSELRVKSYNIRESQQNSVESSGFRTTKIQNKKAQFDVFYNSQSVLTYIQSLAAADQSMAQFDWLRAAHQEHPRCALLKWQVFSLDRATQAVIIDQFGKRCPSPSFLGTPWGVFSRTGLMPLNMINQIHQ